MHFLSGLALLAFIVCAKSALSVAVANAQATGNVMVRESHLQKRAVVKCDDPVKAAAILASYNDAKNLAQAAIDYINKNGADATFQSYFGTNNVADVIAVLQAVATENDPTRTLNCADPRGDCLGNTNAYTILVVKPPSSNIYYCDDVFYTMLPLKSLCSGTTVESRNVQAGVTLHELTHATSKTTDVGPPGSGCACGMKLAPADQLRNADNFNCFATQVYVNNNCPPMPPPAPPAHPVTTDSPPPMPPPTPPAEPPTVPPMPPPTPPAGPTNTTPPPASPSPTKISVIATSLASATPINAGV